MIGLVLAALFWDKFIVTPPAAPIMGEEVIAAQDIVVAPAFELYPEIDMTFTPELVGDYVIETKELVPVVAEAEIHKPQNILVVAPHPDDEILCCSTTISQHLADGDTVSIVVLTDGEGKDYVDSALSLEYGQNRRQETLVAAFRLGVPEENVMFLGFPDGHLTEIEKTNRVRSRFTNLMLTLETSLFPNTPFTNGGVMDSLRKVLKLTTPDIVYLPGEKDQHPDHRAAGRAVKQAAKTISATPLWQEYAVHFSRPEPALEPLNQEKLSLIRLFRTQRHTKEHVDYLEEFASRKESFQEDYSSLATK